MKKSDKIIGKKATVELTDKFSLTGIITFITEKYILLGGEKYLFVIPFDSIFIIEILRD